MAEVRPFCGLRYDPTRVPDLGKVLCPPYDVLGEADEPRHRQEHEYNAVRLELRANSVTGSAEGSDGSPDAGAIDRYAESAVTLQSWREEGVLVQDETPALYLHEASFSHAGQLLTRRELIAAVRLEPWERGVVLPHEWTYDGPKIDRLRVLEATRANISPVLLFFQREGDADAVSSTWSWAETQRPIAEGADLDGVSHRLWSVQVDAILEDLRSFFEERPLFVADGHHRYEAALEYREQRIKAAGGDLPADHPANFVMVHLIAQDDPGLVILPIHRLLRGLEGLDAAELEERLSVDFHPEYYPLWPETPPEQIDAYVTQLASQGEVDRAIGIYGPDPTIFGIVSLRNRRALPPSVPEDHDQSWRELDVVLADTAIIRPLLADRAVSTEDAVDYTRDFHEAFRLVRGGERQMAVLLNPTRIDQIAAVALAGERMPEKSTYFYPKAPTGLAFRLLE